MISFENLDDFIFISSSGKENQYFCYLCLEILGKEDKKGTFYYNEEKNIGYCHRCESVVRIQDPNICNRVTSYHQDLEQEFISLLGDDEDCEQDYPEISFNFPKLDKESLKFLAKKNPLLIYLIDFLDFKLWSGSRKGVIIPFFLNQKIVYSQIRFLEHSKNRSKYYSKSSQKILYSPNKIITNQTVQEITLCEGVFDAIALLIKGYSNPLALLGKYVTSSQILLIRKLCPRVINICLDDLELSNDLKLKLENEFLTVSDIKVISLGNGDPEESLTKEIKLLGKSKYLSRIQELQRQNVYATT